MTTVGRYRVILGSSVGAPFDPAVNDFIFEDSGSLVGDHLGAIVGALAAFYNTTAAGATNAVSRYMCRPYTDDVALVEVYDITAHLDGSPAGSPVVTSAFSMNGLGDALVSLPADLCAKLHLASDYGTATEFGPTATLPTSDAAQDVGAPATHTGTTRPRARHRGWLQVGPLNISAKDALTSGAAFLSGAIQQDLPLAAKALQVAVSAIVPGVTQWDQWSRAGAQVRRITHASTRSTFSTDRRRQDLGGFTNTQIFA